jgi:hypothetical protein
MRLILVAISSFALVSSLSGAQCPSGLVSVGRIYGAGSFGNNYVAFQEVLLTPNIHIDQSYRQSSIGPVANGKSDARSHFTVSQVPAGIFITPGGDDSASHGWAVGDGPSPVIQLAPAAWDLQTNSISQYKFGMRLYCTTGSGEYDRTTGGCNVHVDVCYKPLATVKSQRKPRSPAGD